MNRTTYRTIALATKDGTCPVHLHANADGVQPGMLLYIDAPTCDLPCMTLRAGYAVAMPDLFYRAGPYAPVDPRAVFTDPERRAAHGARFNASITPAKVVDDTRVLLRAMGSWPEVAPGAVGTLGYCKGDRLALIAAGSFPERIAVAASFRAGGLADDTPSSPHLSPSASAPRFMWQARSRMPVSRTT